MPMNEMIIEIDGLPVTLLRKRIKNLNLRIHRTGDVQISAPMKHPLAGIYRFLQDKRAWIDNHRQRLLQTQHNATPKTLQSGDLLFFLGQRYELILHDSAERTHIVIEHGSLHFFMKTNMTFEQKQLLLTRWYRMQMQQQLPTLFAKWENIIGVRANAYTIRSMKTRWGSCHPVKKVISLNLRLIQKPLICLEYVIVHELVHLLEASHNKRFYDFMNHFLPDWQQVKMRLEM